MRKRDWKKYNRELVRRGELLIGFDFLGNWDRELKRMNKGKRGKPFEYPEGFVKFLAPVRVFFHMPFRQEEGFVEALAKLLPKLKVPDYSTIYRRVSAFVPEFERSLADQDEEVVIAVDSSGIKVTPKGEWVRGQGKRKRKGYLKIHLAVDVKTKQILAMEVTDERVADSDQFELLVKDARRVANVVKVLGDGAYDSKEIFEYLEAEGITAGIRPRKSSSGKARGCWPRMRAVREFLEGEKRWSRKVGYGKRRMVESTFSSLKRTFGEFASAKKFSNMIQEMKLKAFTYNLLLSLSRC